MNKLMKWKRATYLTAALGIIGLSTYGIYNTASAYNDFRQSPTADYALTANSSSEKSDLVPGGALCSLYGCAGCAGCTNPLYQQSLETIPDATTEVEQIY